MCPMVSMHCEESIKRNVGIKFHLPRVSSLGITFPDSSPPLGRISLFNYQNESARPRPQRGGAGGEKRGESSDVNVFKLLNHTYLK